MVIRTIREVGVPARSTQLDWNGFDRKDDRRGYTGGIVGIPGVRRSQRMTADVQTLDVEIGGAISLQAGSLQQSSPVIQLHRSRSGMPTGGRNLNHDVGSSRIGDRVLA